MSDDVAPTPDEPVPADPAAEPQRNVFGNLPRSRPGTRSPRRASSPATDASTGPPAAEPRTGGSAAGAAPGAPPPRRDQAAEAPGSESDAGGLEDLAWAGVAAAAEAATLGVRLANRALGAVRDTLERR